jgi:hypothetical protein
MLDLRFEGQCLLQIDVIFVLPEINELSFSYEAKFRLRLSQGNPNPPP